TRVLADLGAEVIKIEPPEGDLLRTGWPRRGGLSVLFAGQNVGKRFLSVELTRPEGVALVLRLAERCGVGVENCRPGVAGRPGRAAVVQLGDPEGTWVAIPGSPAAVLPHCLRLTGRAALLDDERFATIEARSRHLEECVALIAEVAATFDRFETFERTLSDG